ncbi:hypothetical protein RRG08_036249 [Elysia crispata]|uniref:Uncharacterized protein n=1 Tax=Elysia crispata TaxID=231223 RepID=A0AAE0XEG4_9GAST|nr:hypothetical protein RRG08_036249 [Elysia crispata]
MRTPLGNNIFKLEFQRLVSASEQHPRFESTAHCISNMHTVSAFEQAPLGVNHKLLSRVENNELVSPVVNND